VFLLRGSEWVFIYNSTFCPHSVLTCFVWIWEQRAITSLYSINWLVFITETGCVYCAVRTGSLYTGLFISPSGISELNCATTKTDTAERSISIDRESLQVFFYILGALVYLQVPPLGGSRDEKWRSQWIRKRYVSWNLPKLSQLWRCNGGFGSCTTQNHLQTKQFVNCTWNSSRVAACALKRSGRPVSCRVSQELDYRIDICRVTKDAHIEQL